MVELCNDLPISCTVTAILFDFTKNVLLGVIGIAPGSIDLGNVRSYLSTHDLDHLVLRYIYLVMYQWVLILNSNFIDLLYIGFTCSYKLFSSLMSLLMTIHVLC